MDKIQSTQAATADFALSNQGKYKSEHIANFFIRESLEDKLAIDLLRLVKLCYFGYGWNLAIKSERLIDEYVEAWRWGPVIPSVYHAFKKYGKDPITDYVPAIEVVGEREEIEEDYRAVSRDCDEGSILGIVWNNYKHKSTGEVIELTHKEGSPWSQTYKPGERNTPIAPSSIKQHFDLIVKQKLEEAREKIK